MQLRRWLASLGGTAIPSDALVWGGLLFGTGLLGAAMLVLLFESARQAADGASLAALLDRALALGLLCFLALASLYALLAASRDWIEGAERDAQPSAADAAPLARRVPRSARTPRRGRRLAA